MAVVSHGVTRVCRPDAQSSRTPPSLPIATRRIGPLGSHVLHRSHFADGGHFGTRCSLLLLEVCAACGYAHTLHVPQIPRTKDQGPRLKTKDRDHQIRGVCNVYVRPHVHGRALCEAATGGKNTVKEREGGHEEEHHVQQLIWANPPPAMVLRVASSVSREREQ